MNSHAQPLVQVKWCCGVFKGWFEAAGERGIGILVDRDEDGSAAFTIQSRSVELDDEGPKDHPRPVTLVAELRIQFCPWCGHSLVDVYSKVADVMARPHLRQRGP